MLIESASFRISIIYTLRLLLAPLIETLIYRDRLAYLTECGFAVCCLPLFDAKMSPRNVAIISVKVSR